MGRWHDYAGVGLILIRFPFSILAYKGSEVVAIPTPGIFIALEQNEQKTTDKSHPQLQNI
jgi:hypothetical protein